MVEGMNQEMHDTDTLWIDTLQQIKSLETIQVALSLTRIDLGHHGCELDSGGSMVCSCLSHMWLANWLMMLSSGGAP